MVQGDTRMTWTIAKKKAGYVVLAALDLELSPFDVLCFLEVDIPALGMMGTVRERLPRTQGYFQIEGQFPSVLTTAIEEGQELMLRFDSHGVKLEVGISVEGQVNTVVPQGKKDTETSEQYDFTVMNEVWITEGN
jgi:hypothetical protein